MSKAERTKAFIIEKCAPIFNKKGYEGTSLTDILEATGLTKGALYGNFADKNDIAVEAYKYNVEGLRRRIAECVDGKKNAHDKLIAFVEYYREGWEGTNQRGGCPIQNASIEADDNIEFLRPYVQNSIKNWGSFLSKIIEQGKKNKEFKSTVNATEAAYSLITVLEGGVMLMKIMNNKSFLFAALDRMTGIIETEIKK